MKHIYLNLKRFDISPAHGGVNRLAPTAQWGAAIVRRTQDALAAYAPEAVEFVMYLPEAHLLPAPRRQPGTAGRAGLPLGGYRRRRQLRRVHLAAHGQRRGRAGRRERADRPL